MYAVYVVDTYHLLVFNPALPVAMNSFTPTTREPSAPTMLARHAIHAAMPRTCYTAITRVMCQPMRRGSH